MLKQLTNTNKKLLLILFLGFNVLIVRSQSAQSVENLEILGRIWGFLKYHHPTVCKGKRDWDKELILFIPKFLEARDNESKNELLLEWIDDLGLVPQCNNCDQQRGSHFKNANTDWINQLNVSENLKNRLVEIHSNRYQTSQHYISAVKGVGNPDFSNENPYMEYTFPDREYRLLALFRYWNIINYFYPNKHLIDKSWDQVLAEYIPEFIGASSELEYELVSLRLIGEINDTHANIYSGADKIEEMKGGYFSPLHVRFIQDQLVVTDFHGDLFDSLLDVQVGDVITSINGESIVDLVSSKEPFYPSSNRTSMLRDMSFDLLRSTNDSISLVYKREGKLYSAEHKLYPKSELEWYYSVPKREEPSYFWLNDNIGYVTLQTIHKEELIELKKEFINAKAIIVDIRNYPSEFVVFSMGEYFLSKSTKFVKFSQPNLSTPGEFTFTEPLGIKPSKLHYDGLVVLLVNEATQSMAEYTAMALKASDQATVVGSTTAGADGNVSFLYLPGALRTCISGIGVYYPDGTETQRVGIVPDVFVKPTIEGVREGRDEQLEAALSFIQQND